MITPFARRSDSWVSGPGGCCGSAPVEFLIAWCNAVMEIDELLRRQDELQAEAATSGRTLGWTSACPPSVRS